MAAHVNSVHALTVLYDLSLVIGGEVELEPLLTRSLQRLMYHTGFPLGIALAHAPLAASDSSVPVQIEMAIGDYALVKKRGQRLRLPAPLVAPVPRLAEDTALLATLGTRKAQRACLNLPVPGFGTLLLAGPAAPHSSLALEELFVPLLSRLGNAIALCRHVRERTEQLERANRELESFSYSISHDLRAPLRAIAGFAGLLRNDEHERLSPEGRNLLERIGRNVAKLDHLIDEVLDYSRAASLEPARIDIDMTALAGEVAAELRPSYPGTEVCIALLPHAYGDPAMLRQIFQNLIENACKFSARSAQPRVEVSCEDDGIVPVYRVADNGAGFDMRYADRLFGVFRRLHSESEFPGTGVGLAIVKRLVERHGGTIAAEAEPGHGAVFRFSIGS